jgi:hypothetical protein
MVVYERAGPMLRVRQLAHEFRDPVIYGVVSAMCGSSPDRVNIVCMTCNAGACHCCHECKPPACCVRVYSCFICFVTSYAGLDLIQ